MSKIGSAAIIVFKGAGMAWRPVSIEAMGQLNFLSRHTAECWIDERYDRPCRLFCLFQSGVIWKIDLLR